MAATQKSPTVDLEDGTRTTRVLRFDRGQSAHHDDRVAHEEPLEIQIGATPLAVVMRTPGHDAELALGFLVTERIVTDVAQVVSVHHASQVSDERAADNVIRIGLAPGVEVDLDGLRRNLYASSSCGICGKASVEQAMATAAPVADAQTFAADLLYRLPDALRDSQPVFGETGGLHAAALFDGQGSLLVTREDVGRHNATDKVIGWAARNGRLPLAGHGLLVSGRVSFEIVQKALAARIPLVAAVSAPSSLALELAEQSGMTLVGFLRGQGMNVYGREERILR